MPKAPTRRARPPSRAVRAIARWGIPIGAVCGAVALMSAVGFVVAVSRGDAYRALLGLGWAIGLGALGYSVAIDLRRRVREWDVALEERAAFERSRRTP